MAPSCTDPGCDSPASFRLYRPTVDGWRAICDRHAVAVHPSLELHVLLESGYLRPIERPAPDGPPAAPPTERGRAFRGTVEALLGGSGASGQ